MNYNHPPYYLMSKDDGRIITYQSFTPIYPYFFLLSYFFSLILLFYITLIRLVRSPDHI